MLSISTTWLRQEFKCNKILFPGAPPSPQLPLIYTAQLTNFISKIILRIKSIILKISTLKWVSTLPFLPSQPTNSSQVLKSPKSTPVPLTLASLTLLSSLYIGLFLVSLPLPVSGAHHSPFKDFILEIIPPLLYFHLFLSTVSLPSVLKHAPSLSDLHAFLDPTSYHPFSLTTRHF